MHRDIKPDNILVDPDGGHAVLMDLGLAQLADEAEGRLTRTRQFVGTLRYASPEQVLSVPLDRRSDVYSLGATLWELLTLRPLFGATEETPTPDLMLKVQSADPDPPRRHNPRVPADLEAVVLKCLEKDRSRRYPDAAELADDLGRWLAGEPVRAQPPTLRYMLGKYVRRHRLPIALAATGAVALILGLVAVAVGTAALRIDRARRDAVKARDEAAMAQGVLNSAFQRINVLEAERRLRLVRIGVSNGVRRQEAGDPPAALPWYADALRIVQGDPEAERPQRIRLGTILRRGPKLGLCLFFGRYVEQVVFSPDGRTLATASGRDVSLWEVDTGRAVAPPIVHAADVNDVTFRPDGRAFVTSCDDGTARVWDARTGAPLTPPMEHGSSVHHASFSPDGDRVVAAADWDAARLWDARTGRPLAPPLDSPDDQFRAKRGYDVAISPDARRAFVAGHGAGRIRDLLTGKAVGGAFGHEDPDEVVYGRFSPDVSRLVTAGTKGMGADLGRGRDLAGLGRRPVLRHAPASKRPFSPDGGRVLTASDDGTVWSWMADTGAQTYPPPSNTTIRVTGVAFSPDGAMIGTISRYDSARVWSAANGEPLTPPIRHDEDGRNDVTSLAFSPDGHRFATAGSDGVVRVWDLATTPLAARVGEGSHAVFTGDGRHLLTESRGQIRVRDASTLAELPRLPDPPGRSRAGASCPSQRASAPERAGFALVPAFEGPARLWDALAARRVDLPEPPSRRVTRTAVSGDGRFVATAGPDGIAHVYEAATGRPVGQPMAHKGEIHRVPFSPDSRRLATASADETARVWDVATGSPVTGPLSDPDRPPPAGNGQGPAGKEPPAREPRFPKIQSVAVSSVGFGEVKRGMRHVAFSPDGRWLAGLSLDGRLRVWEVATGRPSPEVFRGDCHDDSTALAFSRDGSALLTLGWSGARVWDRTTGQRIRLPELQQRDPGIRLSGRGLRPRRTRDCHHLRRRSRPSLGGPHRSAAARPVVVGQAPPVRFPLRIRARRLVTAAR